MFSLLGDWRENIHFARITKPEWRWFFRILDTGKAIVKLSITAGFALGIWYILYGYQMPDSTTPEFTNDSSQALAKELAILESDLQLSERRFQIEKITPTKPVITASDDQSNEITDYRFQSSVALIAKTSGPLAELHNQAPDLLFTPDTDISTLIEKLSSKIIEFERGFLPKPADVVPAASPSSNSLVYLR